MTPQVDLESDLFDRKDFSSTIHDARCCITRFVIDLGVDCCTVQVPDSPLAKSQIMNVQLLMYYIFVIIDCKVILLGLKRL